ncbi:exosome non-catalytic core subunit rrp46 [Cryomyces antarcticus]|nr:exosome non-catalytic core subunit rrp46 [Cryomyces antarcticus]
MTVPTAQLSHLHRADGSATYSQAGYSVVGAVNGPIEVQRRDELPEEAAIEVNIRPAIGVGSTKERHLESILHSTLRHVILIHNYPRTLIQITLQIISTPEDESAFGKHSSLSVLPSLLQTSVLALLSASIPLAMTFTSTVIAVMSSGKLEANPSAKSLAQASSVHVFAFSSTGHLLVVESEGNFDMDTWDTVCAKAESICCSPKEDGDQMDDDASSENLQTFLKQAMEKKVERDMRWKQQS